MTDRIEIGNGCYWEYNPRIGGKDSGDIYTERGEYVMPIRRHQAQALAAALQEPVAVDGSIALWRRNDIGSEDWNKAAAAAAAAESAWAAWAAASKYDMFADGLIEIIRAQNKGE